MLPLLLMAALAAAAPDDAAAKAIEAARASEPVTIDGLPEDEVWRRAESRSDFVERTPNLGSKPPFNITVQVAYDDRNLYAFIRHEGLGRPVSVRSLRRDSWGVFAGDWTSVKLDPLHDRRTSYSFIVNADGVQVDILGLDDGRVRLRQWDTVWEAETSRTEDGWQAEFAIPLYVLGLRPGDDPIMGFNVSVGDASRGADIDWSLIPPQLGGLASSAHGDLTGLRNVNASRAVEMIPFVSARTDFEPTFTVDPRARPNLGAGGDVRVQISPGGYVEGTLLTDFAQVEADEVQVARDRFPLFFPERRPFFLNGLDVVNFGREREAQLFFSRKIGLEGGQPVPIGSGLKAYGRSDSVSYALLNVQTLRRFPRPDDPDDEGTPARNTTVGRVRAQITPRFAVGGIAMGAVDTASGDEVHFAGGVDAEARLLSSKLRLYAFAATTTNEESSTAPSPESALDADPERPRRGDVMKTGASGYAIAEYRGLYVRPRLSWLWSDRDFDARLGFYQRPGTAKQESEVLFVPRPTALGLQEITFGPTVSFVTDPAYQELLTRNIGGRVTLKWAGGGEAEYRATQYADRVADPFTLYGYEVAPRQYYGMRHALRGQTPRRFRVFGNASVEYLDLFAGRAVQLRGRLTAQPIRFFSIGGTYTHLIGELEPGETFNFGYLNGFTEVNMTRNLFFDTLVRMSLEPDSERLGLQSRLRWRYRAGSDVFLVYRNDLPLAGNDAAPFHELIFKINFYARALFDGRRRSRGG